ncbi:asparagine synthase C-terminal domain-containing protein [Inquilinus limosus]|uniref:asparagine synthase-related protein n=1 Tax=Inquilinus limosus TaxID=171674 RepID=UPI00047C9A5C|nr:asparagine synthase C-terminal domain-containing protein [Inquilinus limosus]
MIAELASRGTLPPTGVRRHETQGETEVSVPLTATEQLHYRMADGSVSISDDLRSLYAPGDELDEAAIYSYLQFGAVVPPFSPWKGIRRFVPGTVTAVSNAGPQKIRTQFSLRPFPRTSPPPNADRQISEVVSTLDRVLLEHCAGRPVTILFSGGIDSGLLAARASVLGLKDVTLVNYSFGPNDSESMLAEQMARHLGLRFVRVEEVRDGSDVADVLQHAGLYYRTLFSDHSAVPTCALVRAVISQCDSSGIVLEGTGADGGFGKFDRAVQWQRLHSLPAWGRRLGAIAYRATGAWRRDSKVEYWLRLLRRSDQWQYPFATFAQNALLGIAYHPSKDIIDSIEENLVQWLSHMSSPDPRLRLVAVGLTLLDASIVAQKSRSLFDEASLEVVYPFILPDIINVAVASADWPGSEKEPKWILKAALAQHVPAAMVYRAKGAFMASMPDKFWQKAFLAAFDKLLDPQSPMSRFVDRKFLLGIRPLLAAKRRLPAQTERFIWGAVFGNEWIEQVSTGRF